jgi:hypothetical protein
MKNPLLLLSWLLAGPLVARAQDAPTVSYQTERDSLWQRAARVRTAVEARIAQSHTSFMALGGTSRRTQSMARGRSLISGSKDVAYGVVKKEVTKHKTHGADVAKVFYYTITGRPLLSELYQQHQLVRLVLYEYGERNGRAVSLPFRTSEWVRGDHLHLTLRNAADTGGSARNYYFTSLRQPETDMGAAR